MPIHPGVETIRMRGIRLLLALGTIVAIAVFPAAAIARGSGHPRRHRHEQRHGHARKGHRHRLRHARRHKSASGTVFHFAGLGWTSPAITGTTYYVSPTGSDSNPGTSPAQPWRTVGRVNRAALSPGDGVLFEGGQRFADDTLMPGWGSPLSGSATRPIVFGSYGGGDAILPQGIWIKGASNLAFEDLDLGPGQGISGTGDQITVIGCTMTDLLGGMDLGINAIGSHWTIAHNTIDGTGDSGMLLRGDHFVVSGNQIRNTGLNSSITYGTHGIYLKASDSSVIDNTIDGFRDDGVSVRYRNSIVANNTISHGQIGIAWFQYDTERGTSRWTGNQISSTIAGIYISPFDQAGVTRESFVITGNTLLRPADVSGWVAMNLHPTTGRYTLSSNAIQ